MRCRLCNEAIDGEHPLSIYGVSPETFRSAWMHLYCYQVAIEALHGQSSNYAEWEDRYDEYMHRFEAPAG